MGFPRQAPGSRVWICSWFVVFGCPLLLVSCWLGLMRMERWGSPFLVVPLERFHACHRGRANAPRSPARRTADGTAWCCRSPPPRPLRPTPRGLPPRSRSGLAGQPCLPTLLPARAPARGPCSEGATGARRSPCSRPPSLAPASA